MSIYGNNIFINEKFTQDNNSSFNRGSKSLSSFKKYKIDKDIINKYKSKFSGLKHIDTKDDAFLWIDNNDNPVCLLSVDKNKDSNIWITAIEVSPNYKGYKLSYQLLDLATKNMKANALSVNKKNTVAINLYLKYGFKIKEEETTDTMYFMYL